MKIIDADTFVVFDLDDTLYREADYQISGINEVAELVKKLYGHECREEMLSWKNSGTSDIFGMLCEKLGLPASAKEELIWVYRLHQPQINLAERTREVIRLLCEKTAGVAILTDGRSITQRLKMVALNLDHHPVYISDEWNSKKPMPERFSLIQKNHPASSYVYIADNPSKDFKAPNELSWKTIGLRGNSDNIHNQCTDDLPPIFHPNMWISSIEELENLLH